MKISITMEHDDIDYIVQRLKIVAKKITASQRNILLVDTSGNIIGSVTVKK